MKRTVVKLINRILASCARRVIRRFNPTVIAVTGSVGKSSTKESIYQVLHDTFGEDVRKNEGNLNSESGLPLTILGYRNNPSKLQWLVIIIQAWLRSYFLRRYPKYLVVEMGVDKPGDIGYFATIVQPDIAVITAVTPAHLVNFKDFDAYRREKLSLISYLKPGGKAIINSDSVNLREVQRDALITVSAATQTADYWAEMTQLSARGTEYRVCTTGHKIAVNSQLLGTQMVYPALFAFAVGSQFEIPLTHVAKSLEKVKPCPGRMNPILGIKNTTIIDDTYNANPTSVEAALRFVKEVPHAGRRVAILGNMNELGKTEKEDHRRIGVVAAECVDLALFVGPNAEVMAVGYGDENRCWAFSNRNALIRALGDLIQEGDLILVKASQNGNYFEEVVKKLMKHPEKASELLVRQSRAWMRKKFRNG